MIDDSLPRPRQMRVDGDLYRLLWRAFPRWRKSNGLVDVSDIARTFSTSRETVYKWLRADRIPPARAMQLIALSGRRLTEADFVPFVFKD